MNRVSDERLIELAEPSPAAEGLAPIMMRNSERRSISAELRSARKALKTVRLRNIIGTYRNREIDESLEAHLAQFPEEE